MTQWTAELTPDDQVGWPEVQTHLLVWTEEITLIFNSDPCGSLSLLQVFLIFNYLTLYYFVYSFYNLQTFLCSVIELFPNSSYLMLLK